MNATGFYRRLRSQIRRRIEYRRTAIEIRQARALQSVYSAPHPPEVLLIGDSAMMWVSVDEPNGRTLASMIKDGLPASTRIHALAGPGYNPRLITVFLEALATAPYRPKVVLVPSSLLLASRVWSSYPRQSYLREADDLRRIIAENDRTTRKLQRATPADWEEWDRTPAPSFLGARHTMGEVRFYIESTQLKRPQGANPVTRWQQAVRIRRYVDSQNAEVFTPDAPGIQLIEEMGRQASKLGVPSIAYASPVNYTLMQTMFKNVDIPAHVQANVATLRTAYLGAAGAGHRVLDATLACPSEDFGDSHHLSAGGRAHLAELIAKDIRAVLEES